MNQFFEGLANQNNAEVTSVVTKNNSFTMDVGGTLVVTKGILSLEVNYWARVYESNSYSKCLHTDNLDWDYDNYYINGVKIDSISKFNEGLNNMGLSSVSKLMEIEQKEIKTEVLKVLFIDENISKVFDGMVFFDSLSNEEQKQLFIDYAISNYDKLGIYEMKKYGIIEQSEEKPSYEEFLERINK
jgi:hypothetical protein